MNILEKKVFGNRKDKYTLENRLALYLSILFILLIIIFALKDFIYLFFKNYYIISIVLLLIYFLKGIKSKNWFGGIQGYLISIFFIIIIFAVKFQESKYFLNLKKYSNYHYTEVGNNLWYNLKIKEDNTYEIQIARPIDGKWTETKKGKTSKLTKQRFTDSGKEYYCFYLENYPFENERTLVAFEDAFSPTTILKFDSGFSILMDDGSNDNPWTN